MSSFNLQILSKILLRKERYLRSWNSRKTRWKSRYPRIWLRPAAFVWRTKGTLRLILAGTGVSARTALAKCLLKNVSVRCVNRRPLASCEFICNFIYSSNVVLLPSISYVFFFLLFFPTFLIEPLLLKHGSEGVNTFG